MKNMPRKTPSQRLLDKIRAKGFDLPQSAYIHRTRFKQDDYDNGAVHLRVLDRVQIIRMSSVFTVSELLKAKDIEIKRNQWYEWEIEPSEGKKEKRERRKGESND